MTGIVDASRINHSNIQSYLRENGWGEALSKDRMLRRYTWTEGEQSIHLFFTEQPEEHTRKIEIETAVITLSQIYGLSVSGMLSNILEKTSKVLADIINAIVPDYYVKNETVTLKTATAFMRSMRDLLASSATTENSGKNSFSKNMKSSLAYADDCRFAHTFKGSFGFKVESPLGSNLNEVMPFIETTVPQNRKIVVRIQKSFVEIQKARQAQSIAPLVSSDSLISSNMCDDIVSFLEDTGLHQVKFGFEFCSAFETPSCDTSGHKIGVNDIALLKEASIKIKGKSEPKEAKVIGMVSTLSTSGNLADILGDRTSREIVINWDSSDHGLIKVKVRLNPEQYVDAIKAHHDSMPFLALGVLHKSSRAWSLTDVQEARAMK